MMKEKISFNRPFFAGSEFTYIQDALRRGHVSGDGFYTKRCHDFLEKLTGSKKALLTTSCTHALEMAALLLNIRPGDEVLVPSFTFVSTVNAFVLRGAKPVFIDIRPDTLNLDERKIEEKITSRTRAIVPVHYGGIACEMDAILEIAKEHDLAVVEDNAHGLFGEYKGKPLGSFGCLATQSFHETKNFSCGEGGALLINDEKFVERAEIIREKGTNRSRFFRGQVDKYSWVDVGSSYLPSDVLAAFLFAQLENHERIQSIRQRIWKRYYDGLKEWARQNDVQLPHVPASISPSYHLFSLIFPDSQSRDACIAALAKENIMAVFHYLPLHSSEMGLRFGGKKGDCPITERVSDCLLRLPFHNNLTESEQGRILDVVRGFSLSTAKAA